LRYVLLSMDLDDEPVDALDATRSSSRPPLLDAAAFHAAFEQLAPNILRYAHARVGPDAAQEVLADTFVEAWRIRARFVDARSNGFESWLIAIATNIIHRYRAAEARWLRMCADTVRAQDLDLPAGDETAPAEHRVDAKQRAARLGAALAHIPRRERDPLLLHVLQELSYEEIAAVLDIPVGTVRSRISRGRARLADRLGGGDDRG
jgi:RNA polymerase sigma-70 factor (ECF subfamily)